MLKKITLIVVLSLAFAVAPLLAQNCQVNYVSDQGVAGGFSPMKVHIRGSHMYVHGGNFIRICNIASPDAPFCGGNTDNFMYTCGDGQQSTYDTAMFPGDSVIFESTKCHGIIAYDLGTSPSSPSRKGYASSGASNTIASLKFNNARYLLIGKGSMIYYADFTDLGTTSTAKDALPWDWWTSVLDSVSQMDCFYWQGKYYLAVNSLTSGFALYDVSGFPSTASQVFSTNIKSWGSRFYNGKIYILGRNTGFGGSPYGLRVYSVPGGQELGAYTAADFSEAINVWVDDRFAYLGLGGCQNTGGFDIVDIADPANMYSVLPAGFTPHECGSPKDFDIVPNPTPVGTATAFYRSAFTVQQTYKIDNCGDFANVALQAYSPSAVDPGNTYPLVITLKNTGNTDLSGANATLSVTSGSATVDAPASMSYGTLVGGGAPVSKTYSITVPSSATAGPINFHLAISGNTGGPWTADFIVNINAPHPNLVRSITRDLSPAILVTYTNTGNVDYTGTFSVTLTPWTAGVAFSPAQQSYTGTIAKGTSATKSFGYTTTGPGVCLPVDFISLHIANTDASIANDPADVNIDVNGTAGRPMVLRTASSLSKTAGVYTLSLTLKNQGAAAATGVGATLSASLGTLTWTTGMPVDFGDIAAGASVTRTAQFTVPDGTSGNVTLTAYVSSTQGCWKTDFIHSLTNLQFTYVDEKHCAIGGKCGSNLHPDIFEGTSTGPSRYDFYFMLENTGTSAANGVNATLQSLTANATVPTDTSTYTLAAGAQGYNTLPFNVELTDAYCSGGDSTCPPLKLRVAVPEYGFQQDVTFTVKANTPPPPTCVLSYKTGSLKITSPSDGKPKPGAHVEFTVDIQNTGGTDAPSVSATVSEDANKAQYTNFTVSTASFSTIAAGQSKTTSAYKFDLTGDAVTGTYSFPISITSSCSASAFSGAIPLAVYNASGDATLTYLSNSVDDTATGNGDHLFDPAETVYLSVGLKNESPNAVNAAIATLTSSANGVSINGTGTFTAAAGQRGTAIFAVALSAAYSAATIPFKIAVAGAVVTNADFTVPVGSSVPITLNYQSTIVDDGPTGNDQWQTGETVDLYVAIYNPGTTALTNGYAAVTSSGSGVTINSSTDFLNVGAGATASVRFNATLPSNYSAATVPFHLAVTGATVSNPDFTVPVGGAAGSAFVIPVVAHADGAQGTAWKTDLQIHNGTASSVAYTLKFLKSGMTNDTPPSESFTISPGGNLIFRDVLNNASLPSFMGYPRGSLLLEYAGGIPPAVSSRVYNDQGAAGTYGQYVPAISVDGRTRGTSGSVPSILFGLAKTDRFRSNLGLVNITAFWNTLQVSLFDGSGNPIGATLSATLAPYNMVQMDDIIAQAGITGTEVPVFSVKVESTSVKDFVAYASLVDNRTGDASFISDQIRSRAESFLPGVAHATGSAGSNWKTDLNLYNPDSQPVTIQLTYYRYGYDGFAMGIRLEPLPAHGSRIIEDVLSVFPGLASSEAGYLVAIPVSAVTLQPMISATTYNDQGNNGTYGQYIPGDELKGGASSGEKLLITGLSSDDSFRLNIGIINADTAEPALVTATLLNAYGGVLGTHEYYFAYFPMGIQVNNDQLLTDLGIAGQFEGATLVMNVSGNNIHVYASSVDNITNDPIYIVPLVLQ